MGQELVAPLVIQGLADLMLSTDFCHRLTLQALKHNHDLRFGVPFSSVHG
jgi:hypothetical protein